MQKADTSGAVHYSSTKPVVSAKAKTGAKIIGTEFADPATYRSTPVNKVQTSYQSAKFSDLSSTGQQTLQSAEMQEAARQAAEMQMAALAEAAKMLEAAQQAAEMAALAEAQGAVDDTVEEMLDNTEASEAAQDPKVNAPIEATKFATKKERRESKAR
jgi:hypothetical protein